MLDTPLPPIGSLALTANAFCAPGRTDTARGSHRSISSGGVVSPAAPVTVMLVDAPIAFRSSPRKSRVLPTRSSTVTCVML